MSKVCKKPCDPNQICNLETGRCVLRNGKKGKEVLSSQQKPQPPQQKPQPPQQKPQPPQQKPQPPQQKPNYPPQQKNICDEFRKNPDVNPRTGRKITNTGKVYKDLVKECGGSVKVSPPKVSPPKVSGSRSDFGKVYNPFYKTNIQKYGGENCGPKRQSIKSSFLRPESMSYRKKYCDVLPLKEIDNILGPVSYTEYKMGNVNISLFGEVHTILEDCVDMERSIPFDGFLKSILTQTPEKFYDFYIEFPYTKDPITEFRGSDSMVNLNLVKDSFGDCLRLNKNCDYKNTRMHYVDYRESGGINTYTDMYREIFHGQRLPGPDDLSFKNFEKCGIIIKKYIKTDPRLNKQMRQSYINPQLYINFSNDYIDEQIRQNSDRVYLEPASFVFLFTIVMDVYALARMFRTFNVGSNMPSKPTNIIVYVGDYHADNYSNFFTNYLHLTPTINKTAPIPYTTSCLHLSPEDKRKSVLFN